MKKHYKNPLIVGVTGGIGSGQSTVCSFFAKWNCKIINADQKAKDVIKRNRTVQNDLRKAFGKDIFNGRHLNTKRLAELAFVDEIQTLKLNQIVHPRMAEVLVEEMERARFSGRFPIIIIDAALIYEINIEKMFDAIVVVNAPIQQRIQRVKERDGMTRIQFKERSDKQIPLEDKVKWADFVIQNDSTLEDLEKRSRDIYNELLKLQKKNERKRTN